MLKKVFGTADIATIGANNTLISKPFPSNGQRGYRLLNMTGVPLFLTNDDGIIIDVIPAQTDNKGEIDPISANLYVIFDPTVSGQAGAFTTDSSWNAYLQIYSDPQGTAQGAGLK